jgi:hypothetical protein
LVVYPEGRAREAGPPRAALCGPAGKWPHLFRVVCVIALWLKVDGEGGEQHDVGSLEALDASAGGSLLQRKP